MHTVTHKRKDGTTWCVTMDVHEVPALHDLEPTAQNRDRWLLLRRTYSEFHLNDSGNVKEVIRRFDEGWQEGGDKAVALADGLIDKVNSPRSIRRRVRWGDDGDEFDRERLIDGHLDTCWRSTSRQLAVATPIINIVTSWGGNSIRSHEQLFWSGAAAIALVRVLEEAGYQTSLTAVCNNDLHSYDKGMLVACRVKNAGEYLRPDAVASVICYGPSYRTFIFSAWHAAPYYMTSGLGHHVAADVLLPHAIEAGVIEAPQIVIPNCFSEREAKSAVNNALSELAAANLASLDLRGVEGVDV